MKAGNSKVKISAIFLSLSPRGKTQKSGMEQPLHSRNLGISFQGDYFFIQYLSFSGEFTFPYHYYSLQLLGALNLPGCMKYVGTLFNFPYPFFSATLHIWGKKVVGFSKSVGSLEGPWFLRLVLLYFWASSRVKNEKEMFLPLGETCSKRDIMFDLYIFFPLFIYPWSS